MSSELRAPESGTGAGPLGRREVLFAAGTALAITALVHLLTGDMDLALQDEGFLWYGVQRTLEGQVPLRDFQSYEPGRYYWCAAWGLLFGPGILALRLALAIFSGLGLFFGLLAARRALSASWQMIPVALILTLWMFPRHKLFEHGLALMAVYAALRLIESPSLRRHFVTGAFIGFLGFFGRNHALYVSVGVLLLILYLAWKRREGFPGRRLLCWCAGGLVGFSPMLLMFLCVPDFARSFWDSVVFFVQHGSNVSFPAPWPWNRAFHDFHHDGWGLTCFSALSASYVALFVLYPLALIVALCTRPGKNAARALLVAAAFVGVFYAHHALDRADAAHLAQAIHPLLLCAIALPSALGASARRRVTWPLGLLLLLVSLLAVAGSHPIYRRANPLLGVQTFKPCRIASDTLRLPASKSGYVSAVSTAVSAHVRPEEGLFIAPHRPILYPILGKTSPVWRIYFLWPAPERDQREMIATFENEATPWALILDIAVDGKPELLFRNSHPLVWRYLQRRYAPVAEPGLPRAHLLLRRRP